VPRDRDGLNEIFAFVKGDVESLEGDAVSQTFGPSRESLEL